MENLISSIHGLLAPPNHNGNRNPQASEGSLVSTTSFKIGLRECLTMQEAEAYLTNHINYLKWQMAATNLSESDMTSLLQQCLICHALNRDISFAGIYAIQLAQSAQEWGSKFQAYCACTVILSPDDNWTILMVATLQRDMRSNNVQCMQLALTSSSMLLTAELIPALEPLVIERTRHHLPLIRRKAILCLGSFMHKDPELRTDRLKTLMVCLRDKDPHVMSATLQVISSLDPYMLAHNIETLMPVLLHIFQQIGLGDIPSLRRGRVCGSHIVLKLLHVLTKLLDSHASTWQGKTLLSLLSLMDKYDTINSINAVAVLAECCSMISKYSTSRTHLERVAHYAGMLLHSEHSNYRAVSLKILTQLVAKERAVVQPHQQRIITELRSVDTAVVQRALGLMLQLITPSSVKAVYQLYQKCCSSVSPTPLDENHALDILQQCSLADIDIDWFTQKLTELLQNRHLRPRTLDKLLNYIKKQTVSCKSQLLGHLLSSNVTHTCSMELLVVILQVATEVEETNPDNEENYRKLLLKALDSCSRAAVSTPTPSHDYRLLYVLIKARTCAQSGRLKLTEENFTAIKASMKPLQDQAMSYQYLQEIEKCCNNAGSLQAHVDFNDVFSIMTSFTRKAVESNSCRRVDGDRVSNAEQRQLKFIKQADTTPRTTGRDHSVSTSSISKWTQHGLSSEDSASSSSAHNSTQPQPQPRQKDELQDLADQIFSS